MTTRPRLTRLELDVMDVVWQLGECSVREVVDAIDEDRRPAYTTVQTILQRLEQKDAVRRTRKIGNALMFEAAITRKSVYRRLVDELIELFGGSAQPIVAHLLDSGRLSLADLRAVEKAQEEAHKAKKRGAKR